MTNATQEPTAWPEGVTARYLTVGGAFAELVERSGHTRYEGPTETVATCTGCGDTWTFDWVCQVWSETAQQIVDDIEDGGQSSTRKARAWARGHAEKCRAMARPSA